MDVLQYMRFIEAGITPEKLEEQAKTIMEMAEDFRKKIKNFEITEKEESNKMDRQKAKDYLASILDRHGNQCVCSEEAEDILINLLREERKEPPLPEMKYGGI
jgi:Sec-independent protein translocase protein TatA